MDFSSSPEQRTESAGDDVSSGANSKLQIGTHTAKNKAKYVTDRTQVDQDPDNKHAKETKQERCERLQDHYNAHYLAILNDCTKDSIDAADLEANSTRIGAVTWSSSEIESFFRALTIKGKGDVKGIATTVSSKSEVEVYDYLCLLQGEAKFQQELGTTSSKPTLKDIPAAAELSNRCVQALEEVADSLVAQQDRYDQAVGEQQHSWKWLIDHAKAVHLDEIMDGLEDTNQEHMARYLAYEDGLQTDSDLAKLVPARGLFRLSPWLKLTERFFMNSGEAGQPNNWLTHAARDEDPAVTYDGIDDFHHQIVFYLRKLIQSTIFAANDRQKSMKGAGYASEPVVTRQDVISAISLLEVPEDRSDFWLKLARRNKLQVVDHPRRISSTKATALSLEEAESRLSSTRTTARRGRSSVASTYDSSSNNSDGSRSEGVGSAHHDAASPSCATEGLCDHSCQSSDRDEPSIDEEADTYMEDTKDPESSTSQNVSSDNDVVEEALDEDDGSVEEIDQIKSRHDEIQLYENLQWPVPEHLSSKFDEGTARAGDKRARAESESEPEAACDDWRDETAPYVENWEWVQDWKETQHKSKKRATLPFRDSPIKAEEE